MDRINSTGFKVKARNDSLSESGNRWVSYWLKSKPNKIMWNDSTCSNIVSVPGSWNSFQTSVNCPSGRRPLRASFVLIVGLWPSSWLKVYRSLGISSVLGVPSVLMGQLLVGSQITSGWSQSSERASHEKFGNFSPNLIFKERGGGWRLNEGSILSMSWSFHRNANMKKFRVSRL